MICAIRLAWVRNSSAAKCWVLPRLMVPMLSWPGLARPKPISSARLLCGDDSGTTMAMSNRPSKDTGAKSVRGLKGRALNRPALTAVPLDMSSRVWPSGSALATNSAATMPPAPGRLSMTTGWPRLTDSCCATARAVRSATPPAPKGTTMRRGLEGKAACAQALLKTPGVKRAACITRRRLNMGALLKKFDTG